MVRERAFPNGDGIDSPTVNDSPSGGAPEPCAPTARAIPALPRGRLALAALLALFALASSALPRDLSAAVHAGRYRDARDREAFGGMNTARFAAEVDSRVPPGVPISFGPGLKGHPITQRYTELVYPRRIDDRSPFALDRAETGLLLRAPAPSRAPAPPAPLDFEWWALLAALLALAGAGAGVRFLLARRNVPLPLAAVPLLGAIVIGLSATIASMTGIRFAWPLLLPAFVFPGAAVAALREGGRARAIATVRAARAEDLLFLVLLCGLFGVLALHPIVLWDGRSIWLFHGHEVFAHGGIAVLDAARPETAWSHHDYPLLAPAMAAFFSAPSLAWNERMASLGFAALFSAVMLPLWHVARAELGRWEGAAVAGAVLLGSVHQVSGGYQDATVAALLLLQVLASLSPGTRGLALAAMMAASLVKLEGFVLAGAAAMILPPSSGGAAGEDRAAPYRKRAIALAMFVPAIAWSTWTRAIGVQGLAKGETAGAALRAAPARLLVILREAPAVFAQPADTRTHPLLVAGLALLVAGTVTAVVERRSGVWRRVLAILAVGVGFALASMALLPYDAAWLTRVTLDRLLLAPALIALALPFLRAPDAHASAGE